MKQTMKFFILFVFGLVSGSMYGMQGEDGIKVQFSNHSPYLLTIFAKKKAGGKAGFGFWAFNREPLDPANDSFTYTLTNKESNKAGKPYYNEFFVHNSAGKSFRVLYDDKGFVEISDLEKAKDFRDYKIIKQSNKGVRDLVIVVGPEGQIDLIDRTNYNK